MDNIEFPNEKICFCVMVPVYRVEQYLDACIQSVLNQTYQNFRLILVDDGSPDQCGAICDAYAQRDTRISVIHQRNAGALAARQAGIRAAKSMEWDDTVFALFLDSDDTIKPNALEIIKQAITVYQSDLLVFGIDLVQCGKKVGEHGLNPPTIGVVPDKRAFLRTVLFDNAYNSLCRKAVRLSLLGNYDYTHLHWVKYGEDLLQSLPIYAACTRPAFIADRLYNYTINPESMTHSINYQTYSCDKTVREYTFRLIDCMGNFTKKDYADYRAYCVSILVGDMLTISRLDTTAKNKLRLFSKLRDAQLYQTYLRRKRHTVRKNRFLVNAIYLLFTLKLDWLILCGLSLRRIGKHEI